MYGDIVIVTDGIVPPVARLNAALLADVRITGALVSAVPAAPAAAALPLVAVMKAGTPILGGSGGCDALEALLSPVVGMAAVAGARGVFCVRFSIVCTACAISSWLCFVSEPHRMHEWPLASPP